MCCPACYHLRLSSNVKLFTCILESVEYRFNFMSMKCYANHMQLLQLTTYTCTTTWSANGKNKRRRRPYHAHDVFQNGRIQEVQKVRPAAKTATYTHLLYYNSEINCVSRCMNKHTPMLFNSTVLPSHNEASKTFIMETCK